MVAIGRALMAGPTLLILDEPSLGLAPRLVESIFDVLREINRSGVSILLVEQNVQAALTLSHRVYLLEAGHVAGEGGAALLLEDPPRRRAYLGPPSPSLASLPPAALVAGVILYWALFGWVVRAPEETRVKNSLLVGFGLALALEAAAVRLFTADERSITTGYAGAVLSVGGLAVPVVRLASLALALLLIGGLHLALARWRWGRAIRATAEDWEAALLTGIDVRRAYLLAFALGTALAGAAGTLVSVGYSISPSIGLEWTLKALIVVVLAGLGSMLGTFVGGLVLGLAEAVSAAAFGGPYREVVGLVVFFVVLVARPRGLFVR